MTDRIKKHIGYYISLFAILGLGFLATFMVYPNRELQMTILSLTIFFYVVWGILHHLINHNLSTKIVIEYILVGSLGLSIVFFLLEGGFGI